MSPHESGLLPKVYEAWFKFGKTLRQAFTEASSSYSGISLQRLSLLKPPFAKKDKANIRCHSNVVHVVETEYNKISTI